MKLSNCSVEINEDGKEIVRHASIMFPISFYNDDLCTEKVPWHWHDDFEMLVITKGKVLVKTSIQEHTLEKGEGCFINSEILHTVLPLDIEAAELHSIVYHPRLVGGSRDHIVWHKYIQPIIEHSSMDSLIFHSSKDWHKKITAGIDHIWHELLKGNSGYEIKVRNELSDLLFMIYSHCPAESNQLAESQLRNTNRVKEILEYIQNHYMDEITVDDLAKCVTISKSECLRCFKDIIGIPPIQYVKEFRIQNAAKLLRTTNMKIVDIGFACGFHDMSYFAKTFRKVNGCSPSKYRQSST